MSALRRLGCDKKRKEAAALVEEPPDAAHICDTCPTGVTAAAAFEREDAAVDCDGEDVQFDVEELEKEVERDERGDDDALK